MLNYFALDKYHQLNCKHNLSPIYTIESFQNFTSVNIWYSLSRLVYLCFTRDKFNFIFEPFTLQLLTLIRWIAYYWLQYVRVMHHLCAMWNFSSKLFARFVSVSRFFAANECTIYFLFIFILAFACPRSLSVWFTDFHFSADYTNNAHGNGKTRKTHSTKMLLLHIAYSTITSAHTFLLFNKTPYNWNAIKTRKQYRTFVTLAHCHSLFIHNWPLF